MIINQNQYNNSLKQIKFHEDLIENLNKSNEINEKFQIIGSQRWISHLNERIEEYLLAKNRILGNMKIDIDSVKYEIAIEACIEGMRLIKEFKK